MSPRKYQFSGGVSRRSIVGHTSRFGFSCEAVDYNDAWNQLEAKLDEIYGADWTDWIGEMDGFLNENGKGWDWAFMRYIKDNPTTKRIKRREYIRCETCGHVETRRIVPS